MLTDERRNRARLEAAFANHLGDVPAAFQHANDRCFLGAASALVFAATLTAGINVAFSRLAADIGFIHFDDAFKKLALFGFRHRGANLHAHSPSRVLVYFKIASELAGGNTFLGVQDERDGQEPLLEVKMGMVKDGADSDAKGRIASVAMMPLFFVNSGRLGRRAIGADGLALPTYGFNMSEAGFVGGEPLVDLNDVHWMRLPYRQTACHKLCGVSTTLN